MSFAIGSLLGTSPCSSACNALLTLRRQLNLKLSIFNNKKVVEEGNKFPIAPLSVIQSYFWHTRRGKCLHVDVIPIVLENLVNICKFFIVRVLQYVNVLLSESIFASVCLYL